MYYRYKDMANRRKCQINYCNSDIRSFFINIYCFIGVGYEYRRGKADFRRFENQEWSGETLETTTFTGSRIYLTVNF